MKKIHIIGIIIIALAIGAIVASLTGSNNYANFTEASESPESEFHVVGKLNKEKASVYDPQVDANVFTFYMTDLNGVEKKVILHKIPR